MSIKTQDLIGPALDWAVAKCEGMEPFSDGISWIVDMGGVYRQLPRYSTDWAQGGPIIEREGIMLERWKTTGHWQAANELVTKVYSAESPLVAAMRCYVASRLGDEVEVPDEVAA